MKHIGIAYFNLSTTSEYFFHLWSAKDHTESSVEGNASLSHSFLAMQQLAIKL